VEALCGRGADVDARAADGRTALFVAAYTGRESVVRTLLAAGAEPGRADHLGWTALHAACRAGHLSVAALLEPSAQVNRQTEHGFTALYLAAQEGHEDVARLLATTGYADVNMAETQGCSPLHVAAQNGHTAVVQLLLDSGAFADAQVTLALRYGRMEQSSCSVYSTHLDYAGIPLPSLFPPPSLPLEVVTIATGEHMSCPSGSGQSPAAKRTLVHFMHKFAPF